MAILAINALLEQDEYVEPWADFNWPPSRATPGLLFRDLARAQPPNSCSRLNVVTTGVSSPGCTSTGREVNVDRERSPKYTRICLVRSEIHEDSGYSTLGGGVNERSPGRNKDYGFV